MATTVGFGQLARTIAAEGRLPTVSVDMLTLKSLRHEVRSLLQSRSPRSPKFRRNIRAMLSILLTGGSGNHIDKVLSELVPSRGLPEPLCVALGSRCPGMVLGSDAQVGCRPGPG